MKSSEKWNLANFEISLGCQQKSRVLKNIEFISKSMSASVQNLSLLDVLVEND